MKGVLKFVLVGLAEVVKSEITKFEKSATGEVADGLGKAVRSFAERVKDFMKYGV